MDDFDKDMETVMNDGASPTPLEGVEGQEPTVTPSPESSGFVVGNRTYKDVEDFKKSYLSMEKEFTRAKQENARLKDWDAFDKYLGSHPDLRKDLEAKVNEYNARIRAGQSPATAAKKSGLTQTDVDRVSMLEREVHDLRLDREIERLQSKYKLDNATLDAVMREAVKDNRNLPLEVAYKIVLADQSEAEKSKARIEGEQDALKKLHAKKDAFVGSSQTTNVTPPPKDASQMSEEEWQADVLKTLRDMGA